MDEQEYRSTYNSVNPTRCVFEKAINSRVCNCSKSVRFNLADREGVSCNSDQALERCKELLQSLRENSRFALQLTMTDDKLSHNAEIRIQNGGMKGMAKLINESDINEQDIFSLVKTAVDKFQSISALPYQVIIREISSYQVRRRRKKDL